MILLGKICLSIWVLVAASALFDEWPDYITAPTVKENGEGL